ncbi:PAS domain-containing protein [Alsobacter sp. KACC 23698]|uniref:histidine kinase n=1 Tax=Alsobacter sp. KACC 23698 TaxID=3149229 RepID=A0AAU7JKA1_9HYPH
MASSVLSIPDALHGAARPASLVSAPDEAAVPLVGNWEWDFSTGSLTWSDGLFRLLGLVPGEVSPDLTTFLAMVHPDDRDAVAARTTAARMQGQDLDIEFRTLGRDGASRWVTNKGEIFRDRSGNPGWAAGTLFDITRIRQAQNELAAREERYRALVTLNSIGEWRATPDGQQLECRFWFEFTGQTPDNSQNHGWLSAVHPDDVSWVKGIYFDALDLGSSMSSSFRVRHRSGEYRWCLSKMVPLKDPDGRVREWIGAIEDIDQRRRAEEQALFEAERRGLALEAARMVAWNYDTASRHVLRSDNAQEVLGTGCGPVGELEHWIHPEDVDRVYAALRRTEDSGAPYDIEYRLKDKDGRVRWVRARGKLLRNVQNGPNCVVGITFDITAHKEAERALQRLGAEIDVLESGHAALASIAGDILWTAGIDGKLVDSPQWAAVTGQAPSDMLGWGWLNAVHPADRERTREALKRQASSTDAETVDYRLQGSDGTYVWIRSRGAPVRDREGKIREWIGACQFLADGAAPPQTVAASSLVRSRHLVGGAQVRASRGLLNWSVRELASASGVSVSTIRRIEAADGVPDNRDLRNVAKLRDILEAAGLEFLVASDGKGAVKLA